MKKWMIKLVWVALVVALFPTYYFVSNNFYEIDPGKLYRSKQLTKSELENYIEEYGIKSIISLRKVEPERKWYQDEIQVAQEKDITHVSIGMSAQRLPHKRDLLSLIDAYHELPRPILVHCRGGSDRTGVADAIYRMEFMGQQKEEALSALSLKYFHFTWFEPAKRYFIKLYEGIDWAKEKYDPCSGQYKYYDTEKYCPLMAG